MLTENFTAAQNPLIPSTILFTDTSSGSDVNVVARRIYIQNSAGDYLVVSGTTTDYEVWAYASSTISLLLLSEATATSVRVDWLDVSDAVLYSKTETFCFSEYLKQFAYYLAQMIAVTPPIIGSARYERNLGKLWTSIRGAINAVEVNNDISCSQNNLDRGTYMKVNQSKFF